MDMLIWLNGEVFPATRAMVPALDRGFLFGESVYETFRTYEGFPWLFLEHFTRLIQSARSLDIPISMQPEQLWNACLELASRFSGPVYQRIVVTGGISDIVLEPSEPRHGNIILYCKPFQPFDEENYRKGARITLAGTRRNPVTSLNPKIKSCNLLNNIFAYREAVQNHTVEALMLNQQGWVAEGASSNVFIVGKDGIVRTPHLDVGILEGVTRRFILWLCDRFHIEHREDFLKPEDLFEAEECFVTSSLKAVMPVTYINNKSIGKGSVGPITRQFMTWYEEEVACYVSRVRENGGQPVSWL